MAALSLAAGALLALGACGDDDEETTTTTTSVPSGTTDTSGAVVPTDIEAALRDNLLNTQGLTEAQADCAIDYIQENAGDELAQAGDTGEVSKNLTDVAFDAGVECADAE